MMKKSVKFFDLNLYEFVLFDLLEWQTNSSFSTTQISTISNKQFDEIDFDDNEIEDNQKEMQSLL